MIRTLFIGSNWEAERTLKVLMEDSRFEIVGLITQPDKPIGRKQEVEMSSIKQYALSKDIPVYHTEKKEERYQESLQLFEPELIVCKSFGEILPESFINFPKYKTINVHYSLLPKYRGAVPIQKAILEGDTITGITFVQMVEKMDAGPILLQIEEAIFPDDTNQTLRERLVLLTEKHIGDLLERWVKGEIDAVAQNEDEATFCWQKDISKENAQIDPSVTGPIEIERMVRAFLPWPVVWMEYKGRRLKIFKVELVEEDINLDSGELRLHENRLLMGTVDSKTQIDLQELQPEGKSVMKGSDFARGMRI